MDSFRDDPIDEEIVGLIKALNEMAGVTTQASCCGHGRDSFHVWLQCSTIESVNAISSVFDGNTHADGTRTHYRVEIAPYHLMVKDDNQLDMKGNVLVDAHGKPIQCVNICVGSTDLMGLCTNIGFAKKSVRVKEFELLRQKAERAGKSL